MSGILNLLERENTEPDTISEECACCRAGVCCAVSSPITWYRRSGTVRRRRRGRRSGGGTVRALSGRSNRRPRADRPHQALAAASDCAKPIRREWPETRPGTPAAADRLGTSGAEGGIARLCTEDRLPDERSRHQSAEAQRPSGTRANAIPSKRRAGRFPAQPGDRRDSRARRKHRTRRDPATTQNCPTQRKSATKSASAKPYSAITAP